MSFAYDDTALYVGARMSSEHAPIQSPLGRRDDVGQSEYIIVALDTYLDHRTAYGFGVTASGVRLDRYYPADAEDFDATVEPVWAGPDAHRGTRMDGGALDSAFAAPVQRAATSRSGA